jgi:zinc/manganese transport system substrate-binding protein
MLILIILLLPVSASAELRVFACEPEWAALAEEIGGDLVNAYSATPAPALSRRFATQTL